MEAVVAVVVEVVVVVDGVGVWIAGVGDVGAGSRIVGAARRGGSRVGELSGEIMGAFDLIALAVVLMVKLFSEGGCSFVALFGGSCWVAS